MKSERRHELQQNELADWIVKLGETVKPYANVIVGGVLIVTIIAVGWGVMAKKSHEEAAEACDDYNLALQHGSYAELDNVVTNFPGSKASHWALVTDGDLRLAEGCSERYTSKAGANQELNKAIENYDDVLAECKNEMVRQRAYFGLARAYETLGDLDKANDFYKKLLKPENAYTQSAEARIAALEKPAAKRFYDKFAKFDPKPAYRDDLPGPLQFDNLDNLKVPDANESMLPNLGPMVPATDPDASADSTSTDDESTGDKATEDNTANEAQPAESTVPAAGAADEPTTTPSPKDSKDEPAPKE